MGHATNAAVAAIEFALNADEGMAFLGAWFEGNFEACRNEWPEAPTECYVGADPMLPESLDQLETERRLHEDASTYRAILSNCHACDTNFVKKGPDAGKLASMKITLRVGENTHAAMVQTLHSLFTELAECSQVQTTTSPKT